MEWRRAAGALGLELDPGSLFQPLAMSGRIGGVSVLVRPLQSRNGSHTAYQLTANIPPQLAVTRESLFSTFAGGDIEIGDPDFDHRVRVGGDEAVAVALFDGPL